MGLRYVKGLGERDREKIDAARGPGSCRAPFRSLADLVRRTGLDDGAVRALARSGSLASLGMGRRDALWEILDREHAMMNGMGTAPGQAPEFPPLSRFDQILWDYGATIHSTRGHPLEPLRPEIERWGLPDAHTVATLPHGESVRYVGLVICRQRPGTAGGTVFVTLEDETGLVNLIIWKNIYRRYRTVILMSPCLGVTGTIQSANGVVHVVVKSCYRPQLTLLRPSALA